MSRLLQHLLSFVQKENLVAFLIRIIHNQALHTLHPYKRAIPFLATFVVCILIYPSNPENMRATHLWVWNTRVTHTSDRVTHATPLAHYQRLVLVVQMENRLGGAPQEPRGSIHWITDYLDWCDGLTSSLFHRRCRETRASYKNTALGYNAANGTAARNSGP